MRRLPARILTALVLLVAGSLPATAGVGGSVEEYRVGKRRVTAECFYPDAPGKYPLVLLLHGSGGLGEATGDVFRGIATGMAARGYVVLIPHFFEAGKDHDAYRAAVKEAIAFGAKSPMVDPGRIGILGFSMGAYLAYFQGMTDRRVKAVASVSGSLPVGSRAKSPPTILLHGSDDASTSVKVLKRFTDQLDVQKTPYEVHVYPGVPHNLDPETFFDAARRAADFFDRHVKNAKVTAADEPDDRPGPQSDVAAKPKAAPARKAAARPEAKPKLDDNNPRPEP